MASRNSGVQVGASGSVVSSLSATFHTENRLRGDRVNVVKHLVIRCVLKKAEEQICLP